MSVKHLVTTAGVCGGTLAGAGVSVPHSGVLTISPLNAATLSID